MIRLISLLSLCTCLFGAPLQERLQKARSGDYIVAENRKMITLLAIRSSTPTSLVLEEISAPLHNLPNHELPSSWPKWIQERAPGHTSWSMVEIDPNSGEVLECYSFSRAAWISASTQESFFATLLTLPLEAVKENSLKRIGPPPAADEVDHRKIWHPPFIFEGKKVPEARFHVYETHWPHDESELSNKRILLYFDTALRSPFPLWADVETSHLTATFQVIDAGKNLPSIYRSIPHRVPEFLGQPQKTKEGLRLFLKSPKYYRSFDLFAIDITTREKQIFPITQFLLNAKGELLTIDIADELLKNLLEPDHRYTWLVVPQGHAASYTETNKPFLWKEK